MKYNHPYTVAIAQTNPVIADLERNRSTLLEQIDRAKAKDAKVFVTGELALTGYKLRDAVFEVALHANDPFLDPFREASKDMMVVLGLVEESDEHHFYNSALIFENGELIHRHRKIYLPNYGMFEERRFFRPGSHVRAFDSSLGRMGVLICNDMWHPMNSLLLAYDGAHVLIVISASPTRGLGSGEVSDNTRTWRTFNRSAAKAGSMYVIQANIAGFQDGVLFWGGSEVVSPGAKDTVQAKMNTPELLFAQIEPELIRAERIYSPLLRDEDLALAQRELERILNDQNNQL
ncbi:carbon-nitrogen hydrolase [bacterium]|nr:carbon-nitrogen hydrolase [bacterium]